MAECGFEVIPEHKMVGTLSVFTRNRKDLM